MTQQKELTIDEILLIPSGDWTPEQTERVKKAIANGDLTLTRPVLPFPYAPIPIYPEPPATPIIPETEVPWWRYVTSDRTTVDECALRRYFKENPDKTYVHMTCNCRQCTIYC